MKTSEQINEIAKALSKAQGQFGRAALDQKGHHGAYATIASVWSIAQEPLSENGLFVFQDASSSETGVTVTTTIFHESGQWIESSPLWMPAKSKVCQDFGGALTYCKRYSLCACLGIVKGEKDDDGQHSTDVTTVENIIDNYKKKNFITEIQLKELEALINALGEEGVKEKMLSHYKISDLKLLETKDFEKASKLLEKKINERSA